MSAIAFVTLEQAQFHLHVTDPALDGPITEYLERASAAIWRYLKKPADVPAPAAADATDDLVATTLMLLAHDWEHRGDGAGGSDDPDSFIWRAIALRLMQSRDPALA